MPKSGKPNTTRILQSAGIEYSLVGYEVDDSLDAVTVAGKIGSDPDRVFKTLVARGDRSGVEVFCIPADSELDLKKSARLTGNKRIEMVRPDELLALTGYVRGGCSPVGMKNPYRVHVDETAVLHDKIFVSAGLRGMQLELNPEDLVELIGASFADVARLL
jgi:Cys-tRNA(Pro)/Cys-tRNA(Cys) deacylase